MNDKTLARKLRAVRNAASQRRRGQYVPVMCARCGFARINVIHETDRENAPEGPAYYADVPFCDFAASLSGDRE